MHYEDKVNPLSKEDVVAKHNNHKAKPKRGKKDNHSTKGKRGKGSTSKAGGKRR